jgi:murein DD-endopeptidase MepM/ murein hydrolase activator NlpD
MLDREGYFNPVVTLVDYAGNTTTYDAAQHATYNLGDFRGRIDDSLPLTARMPFTLWNEGGKAAYDAPLTQDSVYINTLSAGFVTRNKTIRIKAAAERGQRVQFKVNGQNHGALINVTDQNCKVPESSTPSSEATDTAQNMEKGEDLVWNSTTGEYMLPTVDRTSANGLPVRSASQCEVTTTYTFAGDGKAHQEDGTPTESVYVQLTSIDQAGNTSNITAPINIFYDTFAPKEPEAILYQDDIGVRGERMGYYDIRMTSPSGAVTTTGEGVLDADGDSLEIVRKIFTSEYGIFTIVVNTYDAAGNKSTVTRTIDRQPSNPNPEDGAGGGGGIGDFPYSTVYITVGAGGAYAVTGSSVSVPQISEATKNSVGTFNVAGRAAATGDKAIIYTTYDGSYRLATAINSRCSGLNLITTKGYATCINNLTTLYNLNKLRNVIVKEGRVSSSSIKVVDHDNAGLSTEFGNTSSFEKRDISLSASNQTSSIRAASKIQISGSVAGSNFSNSGTLQSNSTTPTTLISANLNQLEDNAPRGLPADSWQDSNIGQGPGGGFSHTDAHSNSISAVDISNFGPEAHIITRSTMKGEAVLRRNMPASDLSGTCTNTYPNSKVWGCYVVVTNSVTGYITITAHLDYTDAISRYSSFGIAKAVNNRSEIGMMGNTGYSTNPHVHYEIRKGAPGTTGFYDGVPYLGTTQSEQRTKMSGLTGLSIEQLSR